MRRALAYFQAERGLLVLRDPESGRFFTWDVARRRGRMRVALRITDTDPLPLPFAAETEGLLVNDVRPVTGTALCYDVLSGAVQRKAIVPPSVKGLIRLIQATSRTHEYQPRCSWRSISARTSRKRRML